jgi:hypothetical protein
MADEVFIDEYESEEEFVEIEGMADVEDDFDGAIESVLRNSKPLCARRRIEDFIELRRLREQMNDPDFEFS